MTLLKIIKMANNIATQLTNNNVAPVQLINNNVAPVQLINNIAAVQLTNNNTYITLFEYIYNTMYKVVKSNVSILSILHKFILRSVKFSIANGHNVTKKIIIIILPILHKFILCRIFVAMFI